MRNSILTLLICLNQFTLYSQKEFLKLSPVCDSMGKGFSKVTIIDNRENKNWLGIVYLGLNNRLKEVQFNGSLKDSIAAFFMNKNSSNTNNKELVIQLNEFYVSEMSGSSLEEARLKIYLRFFLKTPEESFKELLTVDTTFHEKGLDVTRKLLDHSSVRLCELASFLSNLPLPPTKVRSSYAFTFQQLLKLDSLEKTEVEIFQTKEIKKGVYKNYEQFKMNNPEKIDIKIDSSEANNLLVYELNTNGKIKNKINCGNVYAVFDGHTLLKATSIGFYKMYKKENDFYYCGRTAFLNTLYVGPGLAPVILFGAVGAAIDSQKEKNNVFEFKINHHVGNSMPYNMIRK